MFRCVIGFLFMLFTRPLGLRTSSANTAHASGDAFFKRKTRTNNGTKLKLTVRNWNENAFYWIKDGLGTFIVFAIILWLWLKTGRVLARLCWLWTATQDLKLRKFNYPLNYRYGINLQIARKTPHLVFLILLAGDVATDPGPLTKTTEMNPAQGHSFRRQTDALNALYLNARSLKRLFHQIRTAHQNNARLPFCNT
jgi:hypothetical protein